MALSHQIGPRVSPFFHQMLQKYGKVSVFWHGTRPRLIAGDPELIRLILADKNGHFVKLPVSPLAGMLQLGLANLEGERRAKHRRLITPAFQLEKLKRMVPAFETSCLGLIDRWKKLINRQGSIEIDVVPELRNFSSDAISRAPLGSSFEEGKRIFELQQELAKFVCEALRFQLERSIETSLTGEPIVQCKSGDRIFEVSILMATLGLLLQCKEHSNNGLTMKDVIEECKLFYFAGQETTATLLTWTMIVLSMHPDWQEKARDEVLQICAERTLDFEAINQLKIVSMILYEVLRLYPPLPSIYRHTRQKTIIGVLSIPAGVDIALPIVFAQNDPNYWGKDVEKFNPERFSEGILKASNGQTGFYSFSWGPRICPGQNFAMIEAKIALAMILQHFSIQLSPSYTHAPCNLITLQPQHGAPLILHQIQDV